MRTLFGLRDKGVVQLKAIPLMWKLKGVEHQKGGDEYNYFLESIRNARKRAGKKGQECELDQDAAQRLWTRCAGKCELTGIVFDCSTTPGVRRPFSPSIDRIDSKKSYTEDNVRVVCTAVNLAMNQWGEEVLFKIAAKLLQNNSAFQLSLERPQEKSERQRTVEMLLQNNELRLKKVGVADGTRTKTKQSNGKKGEATA